MKVRHSVRRAAGRPAPRPAPIPRPDADGISSWLDVLVKLLGVSHGDARGIRDELEDHLRVRVRDLMVEGVSEPESIRRAIAELGDMAELARSFRAANRLSRRRLMVNGSIVAVAGAALAISVMSLAGPRAGGAQPAEGLEPGNTVMSNIPVLGFMFSSPSAGPASHIDTLDELADIEIEVHFEEVGLAEAIEYIKALINRPAFVHWSSLEDIGVDADTSISLDIGTIDARTLLRLMADRITPDYRDTRLAFRLNDNLLEVATTSHFDQREVKLVRYDVSALIDAETPLDVSDDSDTLTDLVRALIEPDQWSQNGGDLAQVRVAGSTMFVRAPERVHNEVEWILESLSGAESTGSTDGRVVQIIQLAHTDAGEVASVLDELFGVHDESDARYRQRTGTDAPKIVADPRRNAVVVQAGIEELEQIQDMVDRIDRAPSDE